MAKKPKPRKPAKRLDEDKKAYKARVKAWKKNQKMAEKLRKMGKEPDPSFFEQQQGERPAPPPPHERPIPTTKSREEGGQRHDGTYVRRSTVDLNKIEAHLDTKMEKDRSESLHSRFKSEFGEDLTTPDGYDLIPDREVHVRAGPPTLASVEGGLSAQALADVYGDPGAPQIPPPAPAPVPAVPDPEIEPEPAMEIEPEPEAEIEPEPVVEMEPEPEAEVEAEPEPGPQEVPEPEPEPEPTPPPVVLPEPGAVAGVAGAIPGSVAAASTEAAVVEDDVDPPKYKFLDLRRFTKVGWRASKKGGMVAKIIVGTINFFIYLFFIWPLPPIIIVPVIATFSYWNKDRKERQAKEEAEWEAHVAEHGYPEEGGYADGYYDDGTPIHGYAPDGTDEGYYEGEGVAYGDDRYGY
jgi:hypothetical protein